MAPNSPTAIMLDSGLYFDVRAPSAADVSVDDIAHNLGQTIRFNGATIRPITTAEHCARVSRIAEAIAPHPFKAEAAFYGLLHDAHEAYTPWGDCLRPGKTDEMRAVEARIDAAIFKALAAPGWTPSGQAKAAVEVADNTALFFEAMLWQRCGSDWAPSLIHVGPDLWDKMLPLVAPRPGETLVDALVTGRWVGESWLRSLGGHASYVSKRIVSRHFSLSEIFGGFP